MYNYRPPSSGHLSKQLNGFVFGSRVDLTGYVKGDNCELVKV
jgi:hypothetical protein